MAHPAGPHADVHLARPRLGCLQGLDGLGLVDPGENRGTYHYAPSANRFSVQSMCSSRTAKRHPSSRRTNWS